MAPVYGGAFGTAVKEALLLEGDRGITFVSSHATMDAEHMIELRKILNTITDEAAQAAVIESCRMNFHHFTQMFQGL